MAFRPSKTSKAAWADYLPSLPDDPTHPAQVILRTYALSLSLSLGPSLIPLLTSLVSAKLTAKSFFITLKRILKRDLRYDGFAFAITTAVGGGALIRHLWRLLDDPTFTHKPVNVPKFLLDITDRIRMWSQLLSLSHEQRTFLSHLVSSSLGIVLLQAGRARSLRLRILSSGGVPTPSLSGISPTLDLTILLAVRAVDSMVQSFILNNSSSSSSSQVSRHSDSSGRTQLEPHLVRDRLEKEKLKLENLVSVKLTSQIDAFVFWACSARIMWCFFYEPQRLPRSYIKWIQTLANVDRRIMDALVYLREGTWSYINGSATHRNLLRTFSQDLGHPSSWGDPSVLPAYGRNIADSVWKTINVSNRTGVGGLPCELVHGTVGTNLGVSDSCTMNAGLRATKAFAESMAIYLPAHFLPLLLTRPQALLRPHRLLSAFLGSMRSAAFLTSFITIFWYSVCLTRTIFLARLFPFISHDFWDGPQGCIMVGSLLCGSSIWIENGRRRGEMALYVLPRAIRACIPDSWLKRRNIGVRLAERLAFVLSISALLTAGIHRPDSLRGLSRWTLAFVTNGPNAGFWKRKRLDPSIPPTPSIPATPRQIETHNTSHPHTPKFTDTLL
ncbi:uncharacterized protein LACBIDRAFT_300660 [Laccaria bicolor S238N-H82]|uniref:Predicted protein n=1 Tax=Laccaria bicolor (strain S238N-H82 / ATCC MYA-4686) TaxID=486041 RepID=B0CPU1_LACBS|nr:uncharacterized protein LACBIDRAFT_300660 [Laccaria bicolor S238N-H82]EDR14989.1 predicted protein [Laccaria bicolor S238N-H82]|eukprot:XP_001873197.1 predicted protein [Laccaria bicolor S238N-H82]